jgi:hypothetical protein
VRAAVHKRGGEIFIRSFDVKRNLDLADRPIPQVETDRQMLDWLRKQTAVFRGDDRRFFDAFIARFAELIENLDTWRRLVEDVADAQEIAMRQLEFARRTVCTLKQQIESRETLEPLG